MKAFGKSDKYRFYSFIVSVRMLRFAFFLFLFFVASFGDHSVSFPDDSPTNGTIQKRFGWGFLGKVLALELTTSNQYETPTASPSATTSTLFPPLPSVSSPLPMFNFSELHTPSDSLPSSSIITGIVTPIGSLPFTAASDSVSTLVEPTRCECLPVGLCVNQSTRAEMTTRIVTRPPADIECGPGEVYCCIEYTKRRCGIPNIIPGVYPKDGQASLGEFPWSAVILTNDDVYVGGGILIDSIHVITAAHKVAKYGSISGKSGRNDFAVTDSDSRFYKKNGAELKIRLGDWDLSNENEPVNFLEVGISKIINHPRFEATTLKNDISLITLGVPVSTFTRPYPQINTICLPEPTAIFTGLRCKVAGWGKDQFNGQYQNIIKKVEVPILSSIDCQAKLRNTRLGSSFVLDTNSFICAGGEANRDACTGDGGTALACLRNGQYYLAGITAGGIECGNENVPGLYVNMVNYLTWVYARINGSSGGINPRRRPI